VNYFLRLSLRRLRTACVRPARRWTCVRLICLKCALSVGALHSSLYSGLRRCALWLAHELIASISKAILYSTIQALAGCNYKGRKK
jgi:hypothetical protein